MIKAIETKYKGYRFRSRLEARWAVFFDHMASMSGDEWLYEPEGFHLDGAGMYLPDFQLNRGVLSCYVEIKGKMPTYAEFRKGKMVAFSTKKPFYFLCQIPDPEDTIHGQVKFDGWVFIPANCAVIVNDAHHSFFEHYLESLPGFLGCDQSECFSVDSQYYFKKYGKPHPQHCELGRLMEIGVEPPFFMNGRRQLNYANKLIREAATKARSARFEHGERG